MIKRISILWGLFLISALCYAEDMQFVTVLSSPAGVFSSLEVPAAGSKVTAQSPRVNFCNEKVAHGDITLAGKQAPYLGQIQLQEGTTLTSNTQVFRTRNITVKAKGELSGKNLFASTMTLNGEARLTSSQFYGDTMNVKVARIANLKIGTGDDIKAQIQAKNQYPGGMTWTNRLNRKATLAVLDTTYQKTYLLQGNNWIGRTPTGPHLGDNELGIVADITDEQVILEPFHP